jgi:hypothetical protein
MTKEQPIVKSASISGALHRIVTTTHPLLCVWTITAMSHYDCHMLTTGGVRPQGLDGFTDRVYRTLETYVMSPWNVLKIACAKHGLDPLHLSDTGLVTLIDQVAHQLETITDAEHASDARRALSELLVPQPTAAQLWESGPTRVVRMSEFMPTRADDADSGSKPH